MIECVQPFEFDPPAIRCPLCDGDIFPWGSKSRGGQTYRYDRCRSCGFVFVNPRPTEAELARHYSAGSDAAGENSPLDPNADPGAWPRAAILQMLKMRPGPGNFLDIGAGSGAFTIAALQAGMECTALELDQNDADRLRTLSGVEVCDLPFEKFSAPPGSFDFILMSHVLEHTHDPRQWIETAANLLSTDGVLAIMTPHLDSIYRIIGGTRDPYFSPPEHLNHFNRSSLLTVCQRFGLAKEKTYSEGRFPADAITRRVLLPKIISNAVRLATAGASIAVENLTRLTGTGAVLIHFAKKSDR